MNPARLATVYLIRHGETEWSRAGRHTGRTDVPLTARGQEQARQLGERLRRVEFSRVIASPRQRARRTGELAGFGSQMELDPDLAEWDYGEYEGLTSIEIRKRRPDWNLFQHGCPGGKSPEEISQRADKVVANLRATKGNIAIFSHGHFLRVLAARWVGWAVAEAQHLLLQTASVSVLGFEHDNEEETVIVQWNNVRYGSGGQQIE